MTPPLELPVPSNDRTSSPPDFPVAARGGPVTHPLELPPRATRSTSNSFVGPAEAPREGRAQAR